MAEKDFDLETVLGAPLNSTAATATHQGLTQEMPEEWRVAEYDTAVGQSTLGDQMEDELEDEEIDKEALLAFARKCEDTSKDYYNSETRTNWIRSYRAVANQHFDGSKYLTDRFKQRSKIFRPKTRSAVRRGIALARQALFGAPDVVSIQAGWDGDPRQQASAEIMTQLVNYRLDRGNGEASVPWFHLAMGARWDSIITGVCFSKQYWQYEANETRYFEPLRNTQTGDIVTDAEGGVIEIEKKKVDIVYDRPMIELIPPEQVLLDPAADWADPIETAAYVIIRYPMHASDVKSRMGMDDMKGTPNGGGEWLEVDESVLRRGIADEYTRAIRQSRESGTGEDKYDSTAANIDDLDIVWIHENFIRWKGKSLHFWSVGELAYLTEPVPVHEAYPEFTGRRPVVMGRGEMESHRLFPMAPVESWQELQSEINDIANLRLDNIKQNMSPITMVTRGRRVDIGAVQRRGPETILMVDAQDDIGFNRPPDVTASAFQEADRLAVEMDQLSGSFDVGSVQSNRSLNETVGGMNLLSGAANVMGEYDLAIWVETWVEPVIRQIVKLEQYYEQDAKVLALAARKAKLWQRFGIADQETESLLESDLTIRLNIGQGASDPMQRMQKIQMAAQMIGQIFGQEAVQFLNKEAVVDEIMASCGYRDGSRFVKMDMLQQADQGGQGDPNLPPEVQQYIQELEQRVQEAEAGLAETKMKEEGNNWRAKLESDTKLRIASMNNSANYGAKKLEVDNRSEENDKDRVAEFQTGMIDRQMEQQQRQQDRIDQRQARHEDRADAINARNQEFAARDRERQHASRDKAADRFVKNQDSNLRASQARESQGFERERYTADREDRARERLEDRDNRDSMKFAKNQKGPSK